MGGGVGGSWGVGSGRRGVGDGVGVRVDVNEELKFLGKFKRNIFWGVGSRLWGSGWGGVGVDVNEELKFL